MIVRSLKKHSHALMFALAGVSVLGTTYWAFSQIENNLAFNEFEKSSLNKAFAAQKELDVAVSIATSVESLYRASEYVSFEEFQTFAGPIVRNHEDIKVIEWVPVVRKEERQRFENEALSDFESYQISDYVDGQLHTSPLRDFYYPIRYVYPLETNQQSVGYDLSSDEARLPVIEKARDLGRPIATDKIHLFETRDLSSDREGTAILIPVYSKESHGVHQKRDNIYGFVVTVIDFPTLLSKAKFVKGSNTKVQLLELDEIFVSPEDSFHFEKEIDLANKKWIIHVSESKDSYTMFQWVPILATLVIGLLGFVISYAYYALRRTNKKAKSTISIKTNLLTQVNLMLGSIQAVQKSFISNDPPERYFDMMLQDLLSFTKSEFGFIGEVLHDQDGTPYLRTMAITNIAWNYETRKFYSDNAPKGLEFRNLKTLFGHTIKHEELLITNDASSDPRAGGLPPGHPVIETYMGIPFHVDSNFVGMAGIANAKDGYTSDILLQIDPFLVNCAYIIHEFKIRREHEKIEQQNYNMARNDTLTGLANRVLFYEQTKKLMSLSDRHHHQLALLYMDLDNFKPVNDDLGHDVGDALLKAVARLMEKNTREGDFITRLGGDEFAVVLPKIDNAEGALVVAQKLIKAIQEPFVIDGNSIVIGFSIGIALYPDHASTLDEIVKKADEAMYVAKKRGKNNVHVFTAPDSKEESR